jgi:hydroxymethylpyrimidine pyrophosphatase-like HAD family hydrolase
MTARLLASDLDGTLIYPARTLPRERRGAVVVERLEGRAVTVAHRAMLALLALLAARGQFVPATTRSLDQLCRIAPLWAIVRDGWAICANGALVMRAGRPDGGWSARIDALVGAHASLPQARSAFERGIGTPGTVPWLTSIRTCQDRFLYAVVDRGPVVDGLEEIAADLLEPLGWHSVLHGRKLYLLPRGLSKEIAVEYVRAHLGGPAVTAAGDSLLDREMLAAADHAMCPSRCELVARDRVPANARLVGAEHVAGGLAIVQSAMAWLDEGRLR